MKKILLYTVAATCMMGTVSSCENDFDAKIFGQLSTTNFPATATDYENYLMDCYVPYTFTWGYKFGNANRQCIPMILLKTLDITTDESSPWLLNGSWGGDWIFMPNAQFGDMAYADRGSDYEKVRDITRFTTIIDEINKAPDHILSEQKKNSMLGEARLCRGLMMYYLLHLYGPVPVIVDPAKVSNQDEEAYLERPSLDVMTQYITDDLLFATQHAPETQSEKGRFTADFARFCLMRHYLNEGSHMDGYYQKAYDMYSQFHGSYSLFDKGENPYADQFKNANKFNQETIMAVSCNSNSTGDGTDGNFNPLSWQLIPVDATKVDDKGNPTPFYLQGGGWGQCYNVSKYFYDSFEHGDKRAETILTSYYSSKYGWVTPDKIGDLWDGFIINKYPIETASAFQGTDFPLARWADVLLMRAEADVRWHNTVSSEAITCVNLVRHRAGLQDLSQDKTSSVSSFLDALLMERGHEMMFEGCRKIDLIRFGKYYTQKTACGSKPSSQYFPIPDYAVQQAQNSGYTLTQYYTRDNYDGPKR